MKIMIALISFLSVSSFAAVSPAPLAQWTNSSNSTQAVIYDALESANSIQVQGNNSIIRKQRALTVTDQKSTLSCESTTLGMTMVMSYRCGVRGDITTWTYDARSVQAILYSVLMTAYLEDKKSPYPQNTIQLKGRTLGVSDGQTTLLCTAKTIGMAMALSYSCAIQ